MASLRQLRSPRSAQIRQERGRWHSFFSVRRKTANFKFKMEKRVEKRGGACGNACEGGFGEV